MVKAALTTIFLATTVFAQTPGPVDTTSASWTMSGARQIVQYFAFDPATVAYKLPRHLTFTTIGALARQNIPWAEKHLSHVPSHKFWGVSFLEIVQPDSFIVAGHSPQWPEDGAFAVWAARVERVADSTLQTPNQLLILNLWLPDTSFTDYMMQHDIFADPGDVSLWQDSLGAWHGRVKTHDLTIETECVPAGPIDGGDSNHGAQILHPPQSSGIATALKITFRGHRIQDCDSSTLWRFDGPHPLSSSFPLGLTTWQFGYSMNARSNTR